MKKFRARANVPIPPMKRGRPTDHAELRTLAVSACLVYPLDDRSEAIRNSALYLSRTRGWRFTVRRDHAANTFTIWRIS